MIIKDFEKTLPSILQRLGIHEQEINVRRESVLIKVPDNFDFKNLLVNKLEKVGINLIYVDCKTEIPQSIFAKMDEAGWYGIVSSIDIDRANKTEEKVTSVLLIDHFSDLDDLRARTYIESVLKVNKDHHICGTKNIPIILTFSKEDGMDYFYRSDFNIYDERYWK